MDENLLQIGDVVSLKTKVSPLMTVNAISGCGLDAGKRVCECVWFDNHDAFHFASINEKSLVKYSLPPIVQ